EAVEEPAAVEEEAFDEPDPEIQDVSAGVNTIETPTETFPQIPASAPVLSAKEQKKAEKEQKKDEKKRMKQEAEEAKLRAKQEAKVQKKADKQQKKEEKKAKKKKGVGKILLSILLLLVLAAAIVYLALSNRYKTVFFDGTKINGADCTGLTVEDAETVIARQLDDYDLTITFRDGRKEVISGEEIDFEYIPDGSVQEIKDSQIPVMWLSAFFEEYTYDATAACQFDALKLSEVITAFEECSIVNMVAPEAAYVRFNEESKVFEVVPEIQGNKFDLSAVIDIIEEQILKGNREIDLEELGVYEEPSRTAEDPELAKQRDEMNEIVKSSITYTLPTGNEKVLDATILSNWLGRDDQGNYYLDTENWGTQIANFVEDLAKEVNTSETTAEFRTHNGGVVTLDNYLKGWIIDEEAEGEKLTEELAERAVVTREPIYAQRAYSDDNNGIGNTYVEVDLSAQYLWAIENGEVVIETPIVSGMMVPSRYTPEGIYPLNGKQAGRWLRGEQYADGSYEYESWVDYWMPFNGGIGLHDASWRPGFGGSTYIGGGSHGCVNMPVSKAEDVFNWITTGTPVVCYYSGGYSLAADGTYGEQ
ncbi:MAG: L,D-transpeptidase/peptidoglycan binding protein, partial [Lachnospiraceae bacterium]|nr:L,D-transpeptidase/peptidoglycan binding protein [Lachnospiraceae bacterium]